MTFNVDECLAEIWLQTVRLRQGEQFAPGEGRRLWQTCADNVTRVREVMRTAGLARRNQQISDLYRRCVNYAVPDLWTE